MGSRRVLRWAIVQAGDILRSDPEFADLMSNGTSADDCGVESMTESGKLCRRDISCQGYAERDAG